MLDAGPHQAGVPGRLVLVGSDCVSWRGAVSRGSAHPQSEKRVGVRSGVGPSLLVREAIWRRAGDRSERSGRRGGLESEAGVVPPRLGLPIRYWITLVAYRLGIWAGPGLACRSQCRLLGRAYVGKPVHERP